jgi:hypothetical protein
VVAERKKRELLKEQKSERKMDAQRNGERDGLKSRTLVKKSFSVLRKC